MSDNCEQCGRPIASTKPFWKHGKRHCFRAVSVYAVHGFYGCDTGCCGHRFYAIDDKGERREIGDFDFMHDNVMEQLATYAAKYRVPINELECQVKPDCDL